MPVFPTEEWLDALKIAANGDETFLAACKKWPGDRYILVCEEDDDFEETVCFFLEADENGITTAEIIDSPMDEEADFIITAPYATWKRAIESREQGVHFLVRGEIEIEGDREELLNRAKESQDLVKLLGSVETTFE